LQKPRKCDVRGVREYLRSCVQMLATAFAS
jgi:hypothetical protein